MLDRVWIMKRFDYVEACGGRVCSGAELRLGFKTKISIGFGILLYVLL
jgi:hypothetical protein